MNPNIGGITGRLKLVVGDAKDDCTYELAPLVEIHERMGHAEPSQP